MYTRSPSSVCAFIHRGSVCVSTSDRVSRNTVEDVCFASSLRDRKRAPFVSHLGPSIITDAIGNGNSADSRDNWTDEEEEEGEEFILIRTRPRIFFQSASVFACADRHVIRDTADTIGVASDCFECRDDRVDGHEIFEAIGGGFVFDFFFFCYTAVDSRDNWWLGGFLILNFYYSRIILIFRYEVTRHLRLPFPQRFAQQCVQSTRFTQGTNQLVNKKIFPNFTTLFLPNNDRPHYFVEQRHSLGEVDDDLLP